MKADDVERGMAVAAGLEETPTTAAARAAASPFARLPDEIIEQILLATDPSGFASLIVINSQWRAVSQRSHLYLHHLARCPSYISSNIDSSHGGSHDGNGSKLRMLPWLRRLFAREVKRGLFDAYMRPRQTTFKLVSNSISSSSCPGGEGMRFSPSLAGQHLLAYNSSRIYVIDVRTDELRIARELKISRRPVSACVTDDASLLTVLSAEAQIDLYDLGTSPPTRKRSLMLEKCPRTIALSACGTVLAAAYETGIDVSSLHPSALPTDRRAVKCDAVDALVFSPDGTQILGTTTHSPAPSTVVLTAPYYDPASQPANSNLAAIWTASILFPNTSHDCSHATLLPRDAEHGELDWTFTYDRSFETFRAVRLDDLRNGTTYFTGPLPEPRSSSKLLPCTLPAAAPGGDLVAAGFRDSEIWIYGAPGDLEAVPDAVITRDGSPDDATMAPRSSGLQASLSRHASSAAKGRDGEDDRTPRWQLVCDKLRNNLFAGRKVAEVAGVSSVKWVAGFAGSTLRERLVVAARGVSGPRDVDEGGDLDFVDGGRVFLIDFDYATTDGKHSEFVLHVGAGEAEELEDRMRDVADDAAVSRQSIMGFQPSGDVKTARLLPSTAAPDSPTGSFAEAVAAVDAADAADAAINDDDDDDNRHGAHADDDPLVPRPTGKSPVSRPTTTGQAAVRSSQGLADEIEALDVPYEHASPRSGTTLRRAASAAAANRRLNPRTADGRPIEYRRADGRPEHPHESDADNWVPPPPPYQKEDPGDLPAFLRGPSVPPPTAVPMPPLPPFPLHHGRLSVGPSLARSSTEIVPAGGQRLRLQTSARITSMALTPSVQRGEASPRPASSLSLGSRLVDTDDIYDVSPPRSPLVSARPFEGHHANGRLGDSAPPMTSHSAGPSATGEYAASTYSPLTLSGPDRILFSNSLPASAAPPPLRRPSNAQTWPLPPTPEAETAVAASLLAPSGPPRLAPLDTRQGHGVLASSAPAGGPLGAIGPGREARLDRRGDETGRIESPWPDSPLIISTPGGIAGGLDPSAQQVWEQRGDEPHILAPIPRRLPHGPANRHSLIVGDDMGHHPLAGTAARAAATAESASAEPAPRRLQRGGSPTSRHRRLGSGALRVWLRAGVPLSSSAVAAAGAAASRSPTTPVHRRPSRAERSAAKNMLDARGRGWTGRRGGDGQQRRAAMRGDGAGEASSSAGWTDVSEGATARERERERDKKCVVM